MESYDVNKFFLSLRNIEVNLRKKYRYIDSADELLAGMIPESRQGTRSLDLGHGDSPKNPFNADEVYGVDISGIETRNYKIADLAVEGIPFESGDFDFCTAFDFIEHIPRICYSDKGRRQSFIELMNEVWRILKPGGLFLHVTPSFPSKEVFQDPTHVNIITEDTFPDYFCEPKTWAHKLQYGLNNAFLLVDQAWIGNTWIAGILRKPYG